MFSGNDKIQQNLFQIDPSKLLHQVDVFLRLNGLFYKFSEGELFEKISIETTLNDILEANKKNPNFLKIAQVIEEWNGEFNSLFVEEEKAFDALLDKFNLPIIEQSHLIEKMQLYNQKLNEEKKISITDNGKCAGLTFTLIISQFLKSMPKNDLIKLEEKIDITRIQHVENLLARVSLDSKSEDDTLEKDYRILFDITLKLQENQQDEHKAMNAIIQYDLIAPTEIKLSWVFNQYTLQYIFKKFFIPEKIIKLGASNHAAHVYLDKNKKIHYYNPNTKYGFLIFDQNDLDQFLNVLVKGFELADVSRCHLTLSLYDLVSRSTPDHDLEHVIRELIEMDYQTRTKELKLNSIEEARIRQEIVNRQSSNGMTALNQACYYNNMKEVDILLALDADVNIRTIMRESPVYFAVIRKNINILQLLLFKKPNVARDDVRVNEYDTSGLVPLHHAIIECSNEAVQLFLQYPWTQINKPLKSPHKKMGWTPLHIATDMSNASIVEMLLKHEEIRLDIKVECITPLQRAATICNPAIFKIYLDHLGVHNINTLSDEKSDGVFLKGKTALCYLMEAMNFEIEEDINNRLDNALMLLEKKADITYLPMNFRWMVIEHGLYKDYATYFPLFKILIMKDELIIDINDETIMQFLTNAIEYDFIEIIRILIEKEPKLLALNVKRETQEENEDKKVESTPIIYTYSLLHHAVVNEALQVIDYFLECDLALMKQRDTLLEKTAKEWAQVLTERENIEAIFAKYIKQPVMTNVTSNASSVDLGVTKTSAYRVNVYRKTTENDILMFAPTTQLKQDDYIKEKMIEEKPRTKDNCCARLRQMFGHR